MLRSTKDEEVIREKLAAHGMTLEEFDAEMARLRAGYSQFNVEYIDRYISAITEALARPKDGKRK